MKKHITIMIAALAATISAFAGGVYLVSGGDFRKSSIRYVLRTTEPNQTITITPERVKLLSFYNAWGHIGEWEVKTMGETTQFGKRDNILDPNESVSDDNRKVEGIEYTYPSPGDHIVKIYDPKWNIFQVRLANNPNLISLTIDFEHAVDANAYAKNNYDFCVSNLPNVKVARLLNPNVYGMTMGHFRNMQSLDHLEIAHPEAYVTLLANVLSQVSLTNDIMFANVTNVGGAVLLNSTRIKYAAFPRI